MDVKNYQLLCHVFLMDVKRNQLIETIVWVGIPMLFMIVDWVYKHVFNIEYLELSILLFVVATIYKTYQK